MENFGLLIVESDLEGNSLFEQQNASDSWLYDGMARWKIKLRN